MALPLRERSLPQVSPCRGREDSLEGLGACGPRPLKRSIPLCTDSPGRLATPAGLLDAYASPVHFSGFGPRFGVVADLFDVVPALTKAFKARLGK